MFNSASHGLLVNSFCDTERLNRVCPLSSQATLTSILLEFPSTLLPQAPASKTDEVLFTLSPWKVQNLLTKSVLRKIQLSGVNVSSQVTNTTPGPALAKLPGSTYCSPRRPRAARLRSRSRWRSTGALGFWCRTW